jgi:putative ABC transport system permease protein
MVAYGQRGDYALEGAGVPFILLILSNLLRQKIRTSLTVLGMSIGVTAVVALGILTHSAIQSTAGILVLGNSDFSIGRGGSADLTLSVLTPQDLDRVEEYDQIEHVTPVLLGFTKVGSNPFFAQFGVRPEDLAYFELPLVEGEVLGPTEADEVLLGDDAARELDAEVGTTVDIRDRQLTVVGIYHTGEVFADNGAALPLTILQELENKKGLFTLLFVRVKAGVDIDQLRERIETDNSDLATLRYVEDVGEVDQGLEILDAVNLGITILAVFVGGIAVMNTMVMSVFERTREFGILRALGWRTRRILQMVLGESLVLCLVAVCFGSVIAVGLMQLIVLVPTIRAFISPELTMEPFLRGLVVGVAVALLGALYPAYRAAQLSPAQAIRYE